MFWSCLQIQVLCEHRHGAILTLQQLCDNAPKPKVSSWRLAGSLLSQLLQFSLFHTSSGRRTGTPIYGPGSRFPWVAILYISPSPDIRHLGMSLPCVSEGFRMNSGKPRLSSGFSTIGPAQLTVLREDVNRHLFTAHASTIPPRGTGVLPATPPYLARDCLIQASTQIFL